MTRSLKLAFSCAALAAMLVACSSGTTTGGGGATDTPTTPAATPTLTLALTNAAGAASSTTSYGNPLTVKATVKDANGNAVPNVLVTFSTDPLKGTLTPADGSALTDSSGIATVSLAPASITAAGAASVTAAAQVNGTAVSGSVAYAIGATTVTVSTPAFGASPLSAYGTTSVTVTVSVGGTPTSTPMTVDFTSACQGSGKAALSSGIATVNGVATASYRDIGCAGTDTITATVSGGLATASASLTVTPPSAGSIQFISATPQLLNLKGTGGTEASTVQFKVLDENGLPMSGKRVNFALDANATAGGVTLAPAYAISDATGMVQTSVKSGNVSTPVRVAAATCVNSAATLSSTLPMTCSTGTTLNSSSNQLTITTGIPDQDSFSLSAATHNIEGWNYDGEVSALTVRLADHFNNPVPDGTVVNFTSEGGRIDGSCITSAGNCQVNFNSQDFRPANGRVTVLAYAVGEESFTDLNGNGWADLAPANEMIDANGASTDLAEAYVDYNENGSRDAATEPYIDFNNNGAFDTADGKYSGVLCDNVNPGRSSANTCANTKAVHVRSSTVIVLSTSFANITINGGAAIALPPCHLVNGNVPLSFTVTVVDQHGNAMPAGTTIAFSSTNGTITSTASHVVPSTNGCRTGAGCPASAASPTFGDYIVTMKSDASYTPSPAACTNTSPSGTFSVKVTTPKGNVTESVVTVTD